MRNGSPLSSHGRFCLPRTHAPERRPPLRGRPANRLERPIRTIRLFGEASVGRGYVPKRIPRSIQRAATLRQRHVGDGLRLIQYIYRNALDICIRVDKTLCQQMAHCEFSEMIERAIQRARGNSTDSNVQYALALDDIRFRHPCPSAYAGFTTRVTSEDPHFYVLRRRHAARTVSGKQHPPPHNLKLQFPLQKTQPQTVKGSSQDRPIPFCD